MLGLAKWIWRNQPGLYPLLAGVFMACNGLVLAWEPSDWWLVDMQQLQWPPRLTQHRTLTAQQSESIGNGAIACGSVMAIAGTTLLMARRYRKTPGSHTAAN